MHSRCKGCHAKKYSILRTPEGRLWASSKSNARAKGIKHTIGIQHIRDLLPETCPYLGIVIDYRRASERGTLRAHDAPSIDRINSLRGYVPGNVQIISDLANRMKSDATVEQLVAFAHGVLRRHT